ncbi:hypothetical protein BDV98DRAFT_562833 [Pterulicium gracile]|uniref:Uncharacterized protein n=1 Tax=Pterulicium gracile TaxID=1884261 RepID=A0A5C3QTU9_9AGAR|nr:hypothetical protein BDV98DRAFT_562833 [Pterula gracilis]
MKWRRRGRCNLGYHSGGRCPKDQSHDRSPTRLRTAVASLVQRRWRWSRIAQNCPREPRPLLDAGRSGIQGRSQTRRSSPETCDGATRPPSCISAMPKRPKGTRTCGGCCRHRPHAATHGEWLGRAGIELFLARAPKGRGASRG